MVQTGIDRPERFMVVTPHPDDGEIGCGGTIARWVAEGSKGVYVLCTRGDKGTSDPKMTSERLAAIREEEQRQAALLLGVTEIVCLRHPDGGLEDSSEFRGQVVRAIRKYRPDLLFCTDPHRRTFYLHRDHRICGQVALDAVFPYSRDRLHYPEHIENEGLGPHKVGDVLLWGTEDPDTFVDISDTIQKKIDALKKHVSQISGTESNRDVDDFIKSNARRAGERADVPYAEAFRRIQFRR